MTSTDQIKAQFHKTPYPKIISPETLVNQLKTILPIAQTFLEDRSKNNFYRTEKPSDVNRVFDIPLPIEPSPIEECLKYMEREIIPRFPSISNPRFLAFIPSDPAPPALLGALLTPLFNQYTGTVIGSPGASAIEGLSIKWITQILDLDPSSWGSFTMGGSGANLTCIYTGLVDKAPWNIKKNGLFGDKRLLIYVSDQSHNCIKKAAMLLGLGEDSIRIIPSDDSYRLTAESVRSTLEEDENDDSKLPIMLIGTAGTTNTGAIDDLAGLYELAQEKNMWFHIDGAYGAFAKISEAPIAKKLEFIKLADSIALDTHKWLFVPFEGGCAIVKDSKKLHNAFELGAEYLQDTEMEEDVQLQRNFRSYGFPLSREFRGLKIWMTIRNYGKSGLKQLITRNILVADYLRSRILEHPNLELMAESQLSIVCFRWIGSDELNDIIISEIQKRKRFYLSRTTLRGKTTLRVCILNLHTTPELMDDLIKEIEEIEAIISEKF